MNLPLPTKVPKLPCISGVPRPCGFPLLLLGTHASPQLFPTLKLPLSIPRARPPSPSLAWGAGGWCPRGAHRFLPSPTLRRSSSRPGRGAALRARRAPGALCRRGWARTSPWAKHRRGRGHSSLWRRPAGMAARRDPQPWARPGGLGGTYGASGNQTTRQGGCQGCG